MVRSFSGFEERRTVQYGIGKETYSYEVGYPRSFRFRVDQLAVERSFWIGPYLDTATPIREIVGEGVVLDGDKVSAPRFDNKDSATDRFRASFRPWPADAPLDGEITGPWRFILDVNPVTSELNAYGHLPEAEFQAIADAVISGNARWLRAAAATSLAVLPYANPLQSGTTWYLLPGDHGQLEARARLSSLTWREHNTGTPDTP